MDEIARHRFEAWKARVDAEVVRRVGVGIDCLPDFNYWDAYNDGKSAKVTANKVIKNALNCY